MEAHEIAVVLSQPTRARLVALLRESNGPMATAELAEKAGLHPNGVRNHLELLFEAGLVERSQSSHRRGRPRDEWTIAESGRFEDPAAASSDLVRWLARAYPSGRHGLRRIESIGREVGLEMRIETGSDPKLDFISALRRLGFRPEEEEREAGFNCRLGTCPYREAARENREVVCSLHRGLTRGLLESVDPGFRMLEFEPRDPDAAGCLIGVGVADDKG